MRVRRVQFSEALFGMNLLRSCHKLFFRFHAIRIRHAAIHRADGGALFLVEVAYAFRAFFRNDIVEILGKRIIGFAI